MSEGFKVTSDMSLFKVRLYYFLAYIRVNVLLTTDYLVVHID